MIKKLNIPAALVALLSVCWNAPASAQATKVAIGYSGISADQLVIWVAKDTGIFAKNNLDAQLIYFTGGTLSVTAMVSGDTPLIQASPVSAVRRTLSRATPSPGSDSILEKTSRSCKPAARRNAWPPWKGGAFRVALWFRRRPSSHKKRAFICSPTSRH